MVTPKMNWGGSAAIAAPLNADTHFAVTPHNSTNFTIDAAYLYVGTGGDVVAVDLADNAVTYKNVPSGGYIFMRCKRVNSTSTTASNIVGCYYV